MDKMYIENDTRKTEINLLVNESELDKVFDVVYQNILTVKQSEISDKGKFYTNVYRTLKNLKYKGTTVNELTNLYLLKSNQEKPINNEVLDKITSNIYLQELGNWNNNSEGKNVTEYIKYLNIKSKERVVREDHRENVKK